MQSLRLKTKTNSKLYGSWIFRKNTSLKIKIQHQKQKIRLRLKQKSILQF